MKNSKGLSLQIAGAVVLATIYGTSAFAESRHLGGTRGSSHSSSRPSFSQPSSGRSAPTFGSRSFSPPSFSRPSSSRPSFSRPSFSRPSFSRPSFDRSAPRFESRSFAGRGSGSRGNTPRSAPRVAPQWRGSPGGSARRSVPFRGSNFNDGHRFFGQGRISRISPFRGGYQIWLGGWGCPFFIPYRFYDPFRFRLGLFIGLNAFYDPLGYYSVYGWPGYGSGYGYGYPPVYSSVGAYRDEGDSAAYVRGSVVSVDLQSGIVVINDDASHRQIAALLPPRDNRVDEIRPGDYIELSGDWVRSRRYEFDADRIERFDPRR